jgi:4'-phosphopantetheinyl transferase
MDPGMDENKAGGLAPGSEPRPLPSAAAGILLWGASLERRPEEVAALGRWLSPAESARAQRFGTDVLRNRWIAGRTTLRLLLGRLLGVAPQAVELRRGRRGRPELADARAGIDFNVSHTRGMGLYAFARDLGPGTRIGVDIERRDRDVDADRLARKFLTARERSTLAGLAPGERRERFLRYWTCKEAMSKATADGLIAPFRQLDVDVDAPRLIDGPPPYVPAQWSLYYAGVPEAWYATVALWRGA